MKENFLRIKPAFTLAEIVITLIVIGVVAAISVPMLNNDVNDKKWNVARQKAQATIGEAFKLATINGYVTPEYENSKDFVTKVLTKYLKINKQCDTAQACGFSSSVKRADGKSSRAIPTSWTDSTYAHVLRGENSVDSTYVFDNSNLGRIKFNNSTFFQTLDGFSVAFFFNPYCAVAENDKYWGTSTFSGEINYKHYSLDIACMNAIYDMNGKLGPNRVGQDVGFVGSFYNGFGVKAVAVLPHKDEKVANNKNMPGSGTNYWARAQQYCRELNENNWKVPDVEELSLIYINRNITRASINNWFWSSVPYKGTTSALAIAFATSFYGFDRGKQYPDGLTNNTGYIMCVRNNILK